MDPVTRLPVPDQPLSPEDEIALAMSMSRHPAGRARLERDPSQCPTCGQNASGALGSTAGRVLA